MPLTSDTSWPSRRPARTWFRWLIVALVPLAIACLFLFHMVVSAGAAGGCGGG
jgi:hypothetical protein